MFEDLLPAFEKSILESAGSIPVVFEGIERCFEKSTQIPSSSSHSSHELLYVRKGTARLIVGGKSVNVEKGSTLIIRPHVSHTIDVLNRQVEMVVLYFGFSEDEQNAREALGYKPEIAKRGINNTTTGPTLPLSLQGISNRPLESFLDFAKGVSSEESQNNSFLIVSGKSRQEIGSLVERIVRESMKDAFAKEIMMQFLTMELLISLSRALREEWEESLRVKHGKARELVTIARDYLVQNHDRGVSVTDAASYVFLSQGYFTRAFKDEFGISPMSFLMQVRVNAACRMLEKKEIKVSAIATHVGFSSPQRFNVAFRKQMGMTPMQYRKKMIADMDYSEEN